MKEEAERIAALDGNGNETAIFLATDHPPTRDDARRVFGDRLVSIYIHIYIYIYICMYSFFYVYI